MKSLVGIVFLLGVSTLVLATSLMLGKPATAQTSNDTSRDSNHITMLPFIANPEDPTGVGVTTRVSVSSSGEQANGLSVFTSISADGRFVAFTSEAFNLVEDDTNDAADIFVHDRLTGNTTRASVDSTGAGGYGLSELAVLSADGRFVAFQTYSHYLVPNDTNDQTDIFVHDLQTGATTRVSVSSSGAQGNGESSWSDLSADGRFVVFSSAATNLVPGDTNGTRDVFAHDRQTGKTTRVSVNRAGKQGDGWSWDPSISADGRFVAFWSEASNLVPGYFNDYGGVFVHDRQTGITTRASVSSSGVEGNSGSWEPDISADGRFVAFESDASDFVPNDTNHSRDIFIHDRQTGTTNRVSVDSSGVQGNGDSEKVAISADGRFVTFGSNASNLVPNDVNRRYDIFVHDQLTGTTSLISVDSTGEQGNAASWYSSISADGRFVAFNSQASNLVANDTNDELDIFVHDRRGGDRSSVGSSKQ